MKANIKIHIILGFINFIYALNYVIVKDIVPTILGPFAMMFFRALGAMIVFTVIHQLFYKNKIERKDIPKIMACALFGIAINGMLFLKGISLTTPINASLIMILAPILVMFIAYLLIKEKLRWEKLLGGTVGLFGAFILITKLQPIQWSGNTIQGDVYILMNASSFATYLVLARQFLQKYDALTMARYLFTFGFLFITPFCLQQVAEVNFSVFTFTHWLIFAFVIIFPTCINYFLYNLALQKVSASVASSYIFLQPLFTTLIALLMGKDHLDGYKIAGGICIFLGVATVNAFREKASSA